MRLDAMELRRVELPLVTPFRTSFGTQTVRTALVVRAITDTAEGWGECVAEVEPLYSSEFLDAAELVIRDHLVPRLFNAGDALTADNVAGLLAAVKGHPMAKAALEMAVLDAELRGEGVSFATRLGAVRPEVDCGVSVGITSTIAALVDLVARYVDDGYRRIKLKIEPGWDIEPVAAVRARIGSMPLQVDANTAYTVADADHLARLDEFDLLLIEQPLPEDDLRGHADVAKRVRTPICLDESIISARAAIEAIELGACSIVNIKAGRVGGYLEARTRARRLRGARCTCVVRRHVGDRARSRREPRTRRSPELHAARRHIGVGALLGSRPHRRLRTDRRTSACTRRTGARCGAPS